MRLMPLICCIPSSFSSLHTKPHGQRRNLIPMHHPKGSVWTWDRNLIVELVKFAKMGIQAHVNNNWKRPVRMAGFNGRINNVSGHLLYIMYLSPYWHPRFTSEKVPSGVAWLHFTDAHHKGDLSVITGGSWRRSLSRYTGGSRPILLHETKVIPVSYHVRASGIGYLMFCGYEHHNAEQATG